MIHISKRVLRQETIGASSVSPRTESLSEAVIEQLIDVVVDIERGALRGPYPELLGLMRGLQSEIEKRNIQTNLRRRDLAAWVIMEILGTDVGVEELHCWLAHGPTVQEIIMGHGDDSIVGRLSKDVLAAEKYFRHLVHRLTPETK